MSKTINTNKNTMVEQKEGLENWIRSDGSISIDLIKWYLNDKSSRQFLVDKMNEYEKEYTRTMDGDSRIRWNNLSALLRNHSIKPSIKEDMFSAFLYGTNKNRSIEELAFVDKDGIWYPVSL